MADDDHGLGRELGFFERGTFCIRIEVPVAINAHQSRAQAAQKFCDTAGRHIAVALERPAIFEALDRYAVGYKLIHGHDPVPSSQVDKLRLLVVSEQMMYKMLMLAGATEEDAARILLEALT